jgi:hydroxyethylthiazole kinase-like sugar kinase family protein
MFLKDEHGGSSSNHTVDRIIKESPLVQTYRSTKTTVEKNFQLSHLTAMHTSPNMNRTFEEVNQHHEESNPHKITPGRKSSYGIPDVIDKGRSMMNTIVSGDEANEGDEDDDRRPEAEDILVDL